MLVKGGAAGLSFVVTVAPTDVPAAAAAACRARSSAVMDAPRSAHCGLHKLERIVIGICEWGGASHACQACGSCKLRTYVACMVMRRHAVGCEDSFTCSG